MEQEGITAPAFVIKAEELAALDYLDPDYPQPHQREWINRGTDQKLKPSTIDMLLRTLHEGDVSPSIIRLRQAAGLRLIFNTNQDRGAFATAFAGALAKERIRTSHLVTAIFNNRENAERAISDLRGARISDTSISILWRDNEHVSAGASLPEGHSKLSIAASVAGGGIAGSIFGVAVLAIPGVGPVAAAGTIASSVISSVAAVSAAIGATGGAIARMLTDFDVETSDASHYEKQIRCGKVFISIDTRLAAGQREIVHNILNRNGGRVATHA